MYVLYLLTNDGCESAIVTRRASPTFTLTRTESA